MCGIAGIIGPHSDSLLLERMMKKINHRGPDGSGVWIDKNISLGHVRLSIIDLTDSGKQPMESLSTGNILVFNGEIYNYIELRTELKVNYNFTTNTDSEVILAAYEKWGESCFERLRGMFAIAIYDTRKNKTIIARDRFGIKPFYYFNNNNSFIFCSEIKGLLSANIEYVPEVNLNKVGKFLAYRQLDVDHETFFNNIFQIPPGCYSWVDSEGSLSEFQTFWNLPIQGDREFDIHTDKSKLIEKFNETINIHLRSDVPLGAFVSGGIDSSSVASFALKNIENQKINTFSAILPYHNEENALIEEVTKDPKCVTHNFLLDGKGFFEDIYNVFYHHDEPLLDGSMYSHYKLCQLASEAGIKVVLSGAGGDELFGGYESHVTAHLGTLLRGLKIFKLIKSINIISKNSNYSSGYLWLKAFQEMMPMQLRQFYKDKIFKENTKCIFNEGPPLNSRFYYHQSITPWNSNFINNYKSWTVPPYLHYEDRNSMAFGVEIRVPFYDHELVDFVTQFDSSSLMDGASKSLIRKSFEGIVPSKILNQKGKYGFPSPIDKLLRESFEVKELVAKLTPKVPFFNQSEVKKIADAFYTNNENPGLFWRVLSVAIWYDIFFVNKY